MFGKRKFISNSASLLANRLVQAITNFVLVASIARILGPYTLGQYLLASTYYFVFMTLVASGFKSLFTRELSRNLTETAKYLANGSLIQLVFSIIGYAALVAVVLLLPYSHDTAVVCCIMGLAIIPFSLSNVTESIFQAKEKMHLIAISTVPIHILRLLAMLVALQNGYGINILATIFVIAELLILLIEWVLVKQLTQIQWQLDRDFIWLTIKQARSFLAIDGIATINSRMQVLILSLLAGEKIVGLYGSIDQLMQPFHLIAYSLVIAVFPSLSKSAIDKEQQQRLAENNIEMLLMIALPLTIGLFFVGQDLLVFIYGDDRFAKAALALNIIALTLILTAFIRPLSYLLVANGLEHINLREITLTTLIGGLSSIILVAKYSLTGAAISALVMASSSFIQYVYAVNFRCFFLKIQRLFFRPILVSFGITIAFLILKQMHQAFLFTILAATSVYILLILVIGIWTLGGPSIVLEKLLRKASKP